MYASMPLDRKKVTNILEVLRQAKIVRYIPELT